MTTDPKPRKERPLYPASQRAQAVLSVWTERRRPGEICRELNITTALLADWQERAMRGMLAALEPRRCSSDQGPALTAKLERLLNRQTQAAEAKMLKLEKRLVKLQQEPAATSARDK